MISSAVNSFENKINEHIKLMQNIMNKVIVSYLAIYIVSVLLTAYGLFYNKDVMRSGISLAVFITPPFIVYLYGRRKKYK